MTRNGSKTGREVRESKGDTAAQSGPGLCGEEGVRSHPVLVHNKSKGTERYLTVGFDITA